MHNHAISVSIDADGALIAIGDAAGRVYLRDLSSGKIRKITPGVDLDVFKHKEPVPELIDRYKPRGEKIILTVSRLDERKGHDTIVRALPQILRRVAALRYLIVGRGPQRQRLEELTRELDMSDHVEFVGYVSDELLPDY